MKVYEDGGAILQPLLDRGGTVNVEEPGVYMLHRPIQLIFVYGGLSLLLVDPAQTKIRLLYLLASPVLVYLLSLPGWRSAVDMFWKQLKNV